MSQLTLLPSANAIAIPQVPMLPVEPEEKTLRPYQKELVGDIYKHIKNNVKRILVIAGGGLGKTTIAVWIMRDCSVRAKKTNLRSIFLVERNCLLEQAADTLRNLGVGCSIIQGSRKVKWDQPCMVASLQTLSSWQRSGKDLKKMLGRVGLFVLDEAHDGVGQDSYNALQDIYQPTGTIFLGLTASPWRMKKDEYLGKWFDATVTTLQPPEAVKLGWLAGVRHQSIPGVFDLTKVRDNEQGTDYDDKAMSRQAMRPEALQLVVDEWKKHHEGQPTIVFCSTVLQAKAQSDTFSRSGIAADWQAGSTLKGKRTNHSESLSNGNLQVLCSVGTLTKGYDNPAVGCVVFVRATKSKSLFFQAAWRGCRPFKGNEFLPPKHYFVILDFGGNLDRHGNPMGYQDYGISEPASLRKEKQEAPTKICLSCNTVVNQFLKICPNCGAEFVGKIDQQELFDPALYQLKEWFDPIGCEQVQFVRSRKRQYFVEKINPDNVAKEFAAEFGFQPPLDWHLWAVSGRRASKGDRQKYFDYLKPFAPHQYWIDRHMRLEFGGECKTPKFLSTWKEKWWDVLGVDKTATIEQIKSAYISGAKMWHPDVCSDAKNAETQMKIIGAAFEEAKKYADN